jgi:GntR family negative regulator for fad regulon and positive regulator of fabA
LREALRRLERDGWLTIQQGKPTVVNHFWHAGGLNILSGIVRYSRQLPPDFIVNLLQVRLDLAPTFTRLAVERAAGRVVEVLAPFTELDDTPEAFAAFDWMLQRELTIASGNPVYTLIFNSFSGFYESLAVGYFGLPEARESSRAFYQVLLDAARRHDSNAAEAITRDVMQQSIALWQKATAPVRLSGD